MFFSDLVLDGGLFLLLVVLSQVALLTDTCCVVRGVGVRALGRLLRLPVLVVAVVTHVQGIYFLIRMYTPDGLTIFSKQDGMVTPTVMVFLNQVSLSLLSLIWA